MILIPLTLEQAEDFHITVDIIRRRALKREKKRAQNVININKMRKSK